MADHDGAAIVYHPRRGWYETFRAAHAARDTDGRPGDRGARSVVRPVCFVAGSRCGGLTDFWCRRGAIVALLRGWRPVW